MAEQNFIEKQYLGFCKVFKSYEQFHMHFAEVFCRQIFEKNK
jgi:hypothetical protein